MEATEITHSHLPDDIQAVLPDGYEYKIREYLPGDIQGWFTLNFSMKLTSYEEIKNWRKEHENKTFCTWRLERTRPNEQRYILFKEEYRCQRKTLTKNPKRRSKSTGCKARLVHTLKRSNISRGRKSIHSEWPMVATLHWQHNHCLTSVDNIGARDVGTKAKETLLGFFADGLSPSAAHERLREDLMEQFGDLFPSVEKDRSVFPDISYCYRLHSSGFMKSFGSLAGEDLTNHLSKVISEYSPSEHSGKATMIFSEDAIIIAIITPLMQQIHSLVPSSRDLVFLTSYSSPKHRWKVFLLVTHSSAGGLPLGVFLTSSPNGVRTAFDLWTTMLDENSFYGNKVPSVFVSEKLCEDSAALKAAFPNAAHLANSHGSLPVVWTWLTNSRNNVPALERRILIQRIRSVMAAPTDLDLEAQFGQLRDCSIAQKYPEFLSLVDGLYEERKSWPVCNAGILCIAGIQNTRIVNELTNSICRDKFLHRMRSLPFPLLVDFLLHRLDTHYLTRITHVGFGNTDSIFASRFSSKPKNIPVMDITKLGDNHYSVGSVKSNQRSHEVLSDVVLCSCGSGVIELPCLHQAAVYHKHNLLPKDFPFPTPKLRILLWRLAFGETETPDDWFTLKEAVESREVNLEEIAIEEESPTEVSYLEETQMILSELQERLQQPQNEVFAREFINSYREINSETQILNACANFGKDFKDDQNVTYVLMEEVPMGHS